VAKADDPFLRSQRSSSRPSFDLHLHVEALQARDCSLSVGLGAIDEREEAGHLQVVLVVGVEGRATSSGPRPDGDHAAAGGELVVEHGLRPRMDGARRY
jgi:hypothetical protein